MRHLVEEKRERGGFHQLRPGQRVEFSRTKIGALEAASLVAPVLTDADSH
jgi:cold shock CspA family protein